MVMKAIKIAMRVAQAIKRAEQALVRAQNEAKHMVQEASNWDNHKAAAAHVAMADRKVRVAKARLAEAKAR
jgi:hypothetical protein